MGQPAEFSGGIRHDWQAAEVRHLLELPLTDLLYQAQTVHRQHFAPDRVQISTLLSVKTGGCPEDCAYCPQSAHHHTGLDKQKLMAVEAVLDKARAAKEAGSERFCMGAAWRSPHQRDMPYVLSMIRGVKALGMETCMTLGMLDEEQSQQLAEAGLDYYNHNLDTSPGYYGEIISTRTYGERLATLEHVRQAGMKVCSGGIIGMGEALTDRAELLVQLASLTPQPESVPVNLLVRAEGTPLQDVQPPDWTEFVRIVAVARIMMPRSHVRLSAGREQMSEEMQAMCFLAGANSIFYGECLLTTPNPEMQKDRALLQKLGINRQDSDLKTPQPDQKNEQLLFYNAAADSI